MDEKRFELSILVPCFNEEGNISELTERVNRLFKAKDIGGQLVLVDDKSTDGTRNDIEAVVKKYPDNSVGVYHDKNQGMEAGWRSALKHSSGDLVCVIDADLQYLPEDIGRLYDCYQQSGVDCVQGNRSSIGRERGSRYLLSVVLNGILNILFGMRLKDNKSGFFLTRREVFQDILFHRYYYHYFQTFIAVAAKSKGYSIQEVEVLFDKRRVGQSYLLSIPFVTIFKTIHDISKAFFEYNFHSTKEIFLDKYLAEKTKDIEDKSPKYSLFRKWYIKFYGLLMPLHHWMIGKPAIDYYRTLRKTQWLSTEEIEDLQLLQLQKLLEHVYRHVPYYRKVFNKLKITPRDIKKIDDLQKLPLLDKPIIREHLYFDLFSDNHDKRKVSRISTSGSTGEPFICYVDKKQLEMRWAATLRSQEWTGYRFGDKCVRLWHQTIGMKRLQIIKEKLDALLCRRKFIPAYSISDNNIHKFVDSITKHKPTFIDGYAESFNFLASYFKDNELKKNSLCGIMSSAQTLSRQSREVIENAFNTKVFDKYGSREFSGIAYECSENSGHHVVAESYIVEIIKDGRPAKPGETGEVVITDLNNYCMPFIRYRVGDIAVATGKECGCGRGLPLIGDIQGRTQAIIFGTKNQYVPGTFFAHLFKEYDYAIKQFQVEQSKLGEITLRIVKAERFTEDALNKLLITLREHLGQHMQINVEYCDLIPLGRTGKYQHSISKLGVEFQNMADNNYELRT